MVMNDSAPPGRCAGEDGGSSVRAGEADVVAIGLNYAFGVQDENVVDTLAVRLAPRSRQRRSGLVHMKTRLLSISSPDLS